MMFEFLEGGKNPRLCVLLMVQFWVVWFAFSETFPFCRNTAGLSTFVSFVALQLERRGIGSSLKCCGIGSSVKS